MYIVARGKKNKMGDRSDAINQYTDVDGPGPPVIMNATCVPGTNGTSIFLQWAAPEHFYKSVDEYFISYFNDPNNVTKIRVLMPKDILNSSVCKLKLLNNLLPLFIIYLLGLFNQILNYYYFTDQPVYCSKFNR